MPVVTADALDAREHVVVDQVTGVSCRNKAWSVTPTEDAAMAQAKYWAMARGADVISGVACTHDDSTSVELNCWSHVSCSARAIKWVGDGAP